MSDGGMTETSLLDYDAFGGTSNRAVLLYPRECECACARVACVCRGGFLLHPRLTGLAALFGCTGTAWNMDDFGGDGEATSMQDGGDIEARPQICLTDPRFACQRGTGRRRQSGPRLSS